MGFLEAAAVVYLRQLYYPEGFAFPLKPLLFTELSVEYLREISTIVMLIAIAVVAGSGFIERFAYFLYCFGIWDIFYYLWLKALLAWPRSLLTWDILFLIPVVWAGPILAPVLCAATLVLLGSAILFHQERDGSVSLRRSEWTLLASGSFVIITTFMWDYGKIIIQGGFISRFLSLGEDRRFLTIIAGHVPGPFPWLLFAVGEGLLLAFLVSFLRRTRRAF